jgi:hypothetical protein
MRAGTWATCRDIAAARVSWERARKIADALPIDEPHRAGMRIAPRTMLCGTVYRVHMSVAAARFDELRQLCTAAGDKASLAIGMAGLVMDHGFQGRMREASQLASEAMAFIESVGDPILTVGLSMLAAYAKAESGEWTDVLRWSQRVIDLADGDPSKGNFIFGSPLALALTARAIVRYCSGRPGWPDDLRHGLAMARSADPVSYARVVGWVYSPAIPSGVLRPDDSAVREIEDALQIAERSGDDLALTTARRTLGVALVHRQTAAERDRGHKLLAEVGDVSCAGNSTWPISRSSICAPPSTISSARDSCWSGVCLRRGVLVETLLDRGADGDVAEAEAAIERLAAAPTDEGLVIREIWLLRLRALLARARGDESATATIGIATVTSRERLALRRTSLGPRRCHNGGGSTPLLTPY